MCKHNSEFSFNDVKVIFAYAGDFHVRICDDCTKRLLKFLDGKE